MPHLISPSILAADFGKLDAEVHMLNESKADLIHVDVMDGCFVPNISFGFPVLKSIQKASQKPLDVHLMIVDPDRYLEAFVKGGAEILSVHQEACTHLHRTLSEIRNLGAKAGVVLNPATPVSTLEDILPLADMVMLMSVNPGFGGQKFIQNTFNKVRKLRQMIDNQGLSTLIEIDGGVTDQNAQSLLNAGADILVAGSYVFKSTDPKATIASLKGLERAYQV